MIIQRIYQLITICLTICYADAAFSASQPDRLQTFFHSFDSRAYIDTSYNYLANKNVFTSGLFDRLFDLEPNGFTLQQFSGEVSKLNDPGLGADLYLIGGNDANRIAPSGWNPYFGSQTLAVAPEKAYLQYAYSQLKIRAGALDSLVGLESDDPTVNMNFSQSFISYALPGTNLGVRAIFAANNKVNLFVGLGNGMSTFRNPTKLTMLEYAIEYINEDSISIGFHALNGNNTITGVNVNSDEDHEFIGASLGPTSRFNLFDIVGNYQLTKKLALVFDADYFTQIKGLRPDGSIANVVWQGIAGYIKYTFNDKWQLAGRAEVFDDTDGFVTGVRQNLRDAVVTLQYQPRHYLIFRAETRHDLSNVKSYINSTGGGNTDFQQSFALEGIYLFL